MSKMTFLGMLTTLHWLGGCAPETSQPILRKNLGLDLAQVGSFISVSATRGAQQGLRNAPVRLGGAERALSDGSSPQQTGLYALKLDGDTLAVSFIEGNESGQFPEPSVTAIVPTASWILFSTLGGPTSSLYKRQDDGTIAPVDCTLIAARRSDGAIFCASLAINDGSGDPPRSVPKADATGGVVYAMTTGEAGELYRIVLSGAQGPTAEPLDLHANWFQVNGAGDVLANSYMSIDHSTSRSEILPLAGGSAYVTQTRNAFFAIAGEAGAKDQDTFYIPEDTSGTNCKWAIRTVTPSGGSFVESTQPLGLQDGCGLGYLFNLGGAYYMLRISDGTAQSEMFRVFEKGAVVANPVAEPFTGTDRVINVGNATIFQAAGHVVFLASDSSGYKFVRHDGTTRQEIPLAADLELSKVTFSTSGTIEFLGTRTLTQERVLGSVAAGSSTVVVSSAASLPTSQVVAFTRVN